VSRYAKQGKAPGDQDGLMMTSPRRANPPGQKTLAVLRKNREVPVGAQQRVSVWEIAGVDRGI
jgi:hypothetical protein